MLLLPSGSTLGALPVVLPAPRRGAAGLDTGLVLGKHRLQRLTVLAEEWLCLGRELGQRQLMTGMTWIVWILRRIYGLLS